MQPKIEVQTLNYRYTKISLMHSSAKHRKPHCKQDERSSSPRYAV